MVLPAPNLDDRRFQDIVDEAKTRISRLCEEWTDHNVSDPGVTLIELFAWMTEMLIFRLNQVPDKSYITFMELMGVRLEPPEPARVPLTFTLTERLGVGSDPVLVPAGTEVARKQSSATQAPISFRTESDLLVIAPGQPVILKFDAEGQPGGAVGAEPFAAFSAAPRKDESFWLGFPSDVSWQTLVLSVRCTRAQGAAIDPRDPPLRWEGWCGEWRKAELDRDTTAALNRDGEVELRLPRAMREHQDLAARVDAETGAPLYPGYRWIRCSYAPRDERQKGYNASPEIQIIGAVTAGGTVQAAHAMSVAAEIVGRSDGMPGQTFRLEYAPVLPLGPDEYVEVQDEDGTWERWIQPGQPHFGGSEGRRHFLLDGVSGQISFGPLIREPDGSTRQYGEIPLRGRQIRISGYRSGGGTLGNTVGRRELSELKRTLPRVRSVTNHDLPVGGRDAEHIDRAKFRAPQILRSGDRAVTAGDYERLARAAHKGLARVRCLQPEAAGTNGQPAYNTVQVLLVPSVNPADALRVTPERLKLGPEDELFATVQRYLDERRMLTTRLQIGVPRYQQVTITARIRAHEHARKTLGWEAETRLCRFLNPLIGGNPGGGEGEGWPFDRSLYVSDIIMLLQGIPGVMYIEWVSLKTDEHTEGQGPVHLAKDQLIVSGQHCIEVL
ncbi:MAG: putative baseplate assembly protein [Chloroflexales bacterium]|nr:putative baseplate assembly protein [Chloroflexales bacterium]